MAELPRVRVWADALIRMHLDESWTFAFDHAKTRAGLCNFTAKRISLSRHIALRSDDDDVHQTLLHEVAHAIAGSDAAHGPKWKRIARELGYVGGRTHDGEIAHELAPWLGVCPAGHEHAKFRRPSRETSCAKCSRSFSRSHLIVWRKR